MINNNKYSIEDFYVGELYLYNNFGNLLSPTAVLDGKDKMKKLEESGAINFQKDLISRYIDWDNRREYNGFLTIFYKQNNEYICLHNGISYRENGANIIDNLIPLNELLPKIDCFEITKLSFEQAINLFGILFETKSDETRLYRGSEMPLSDFLVGDLSLKEKTPIEPNDNRIEYINLPHHIMLSKTNLETYSYGSSNYVYTVYKCLFLKDGVDLYNINNNQFYNPYEDKFDSIITLKEYLQGFEQKTPHETISIPKALRLFKRTL